MLADPSSTQHSQSPLLTRLLHPAKWSSTGIQPPAHRTSNTQPLYVLAFRPLFAPAPAPPALSFFAVAAPPFFPAAALVLSFFFGAGVLFVTLASSSFFGRPLGARCPAAVVLALGFVAFVEPLGLPLLPAPLAPAAPPLLAAAFFSLGSATAGAVSFLAFLLEAGAEAESSALRFFDDPEAADFDFAGVDLGVLLFFSFAASASSNGSSSSLSWIEPSSWPGLAPPALLSPVPLTLSGCFSST